MFESLDSICSLRFGGVATSYVDHHWIKGTGFVAGSTGNISGSGEHLEYPKNPFPPKVIITHSIRAEALLDVGR